tara:strand:+ start:177 stop:647 length:471 start_codon:yes stop_codon:yes gene_type:complete
MPVVDSNTQLLDTSTVIANRLAMAMEETSGRKTPLQAQLLAVARESSMDDADVTQIGNTVFIGHRGKGKASKAMSGYVYNSDTGRNFVNNSIKYLAYLQDKGINRYSTGLSKSARPVHEIIKRKLINTDTEIFAKFHRDRTYLFARIGEDSLKGMA